jgi:hypothetical protein
VIVPCVALKDVLNDIPLAIDIWFLKTDMQGFDFRTVQSVGSLIQRIPYLIMEVSYDNVHSYDGMSNVRIHKAASRGALAAGTKQTCRTEVKGAQVRTCTGWIDR